MKLRIHAPFRCHFNLNLKLVLSNQAIYHQHWDSIATNFASTKSDIGQVSFLHANQKSDFSGVKYITINRDASEITNYETIRIYPKQTIVPYVQDAILKANEMLGKEIGSEFFDILLDSAIVRVFSRTIALFEITFELSERIFLLNNIGQFLEDLQYWTTSFVTLTIDNFYKDKLFFFFVGLFKSDKYKRLIIEPGKYPAFPELNIYKKRWWFFNKFSYSNVSLEVGGQTLWVNRTIYCNETSLENVRILSKFWLLPLNPQRDIVANIESSAVYLGWGNNMFRVEPSSRISQDAWTSLLVAQYFYAVISTVDQNITRFIGISTGDLSVKKARKLSKSLQNIIASEHILLVQFNEIPRQLQGLRRAFFIDVSSKWEIGELINSLDNKIKICERQVENLYQKRTFISQVVMEIILFFIGGVALVEFFMNVSDYSRSLIGAPILPKDGDGVLGILDAGSRYPPDGMVWAGIVVFLILIIIFINLRFKLR